MADASSAPQGATRRSLRRWGDRLLPIGFIGALVIVYQAAVVSGLIDGMFLPRVEDVVTAGASLIVGPTFWASVGNTWTAAAIGFAFGALIAIPLGLLAGRNPAVYLFCRPLVEFLRPLPSVAMIPLVVLLWGPSLTSKAFLAFFTTIWPVFIQTAYAVGSIKPTSIETAMSFGLNEWAILRRIVLPSSLAAIFTSLRVQASIALLVTITAEAALGGGGGLGLLVFQFDQTGDYARMFALLIFIGVQGMLLASVLARGERAIMPWHPAFRKEAA